MENLVNDFCAFTIIFLLLISLAVFAALGYVLIKDIFKNK